MVLINKEGMRMTHLWMVMRMAMRWRPLVTTMLMLMMRAMIVMMQMFLRWMFMHKFSIALPRPNQGRQPGKDNNRTTHYECRHVNTVTRPQLPG